MGIEGVVEPSYKYITCESGFGAAASLTSLSRGWGGFGAHPSDADCSHGTDFVRPVEWRRRVVRKLIGDWLNDILGVGRQVARQVCDTCICIQYTYT